MNSIFQFIHHNKKINFSIIVVTAYCFGLLLLRAKITQSVYLFFLIWNLMLAILPYLISTYLSMDSSRNNKWTNALLTFIWLAFLPNTFYIITDLVHIVKSKGNLFYLDLIIISSFAVTGFLLGLLSIIEMEKTIIKFNFSSKIIRHGLFIICLLNGLGIYIGRVLRFNSWDILSNPIDLFSTIQSELISIETLLFSGLFGTFIYLALIIYKNINLTTCKNDQTTI